MEYITIIFVFQRTNKTTLPSLNVDVAWRKGYTGKGVLVAVVDEGLFPNNEELKNNYVSIEE